MTQPFDERNALWLRILTPERVRLETSAHWVQIPTVDGLLGIWPLHAPLIGLVIPGDVEYEAEDGVHREWVEGGVLNIRHGQVLILTGSREQGRMSSASATGKWEDSVQEIADVLGDLEQPKEEIPETRSGTS